MNADINPRAEVANLFPWHIRNKLVDAARAKDYREIDALTDTLANLGIVRPRNDTSLYPSSLARCEKMGAGA